MTLCPSSIDDGVTIQVTSGTRAIDFIVCIITITVSLVTLHRIPEAIVVIVLGLVEVITDFDAVVLPVAIGISV